MVITNWPLSQSPPPCSAFRRRPPTAPTPAPWRGFPAAFFRRAVAHASRGPPPPLFGFALALSSPCHAPPVSPPAATAAPPWIAPGRAPGPLPARARAPQRPQRPIPLLLLLSPRSHAIERRRRSTPYSGKFDAAAEPPHRRSSARSDPLASTAVASRNSQTTSPHPILTGAPPPPFSSAADPPCSVEPPPPSPVAPEVCLGPL